MDLLVLIMPLGAVQYVLRPGLLFFGESAVFCFPFLHRGETGLDFDGILKCAGFVVCCCSSERLPVGTHGAFALAFLVARLGHIGTLDHIRCMSIPFRRTSDAWPVREGGLEWEWG